MAHIANVEPPRDTNRRLAGHEASARPPIKSRRRKTLRTLLLIAAGILALAASFALLLPLIGDEFTM